MKGRPAIYLRLSGGDERTRTADPLLAKQVLYRLSYVPEAPIIDIGRSLARLSRTLRRSWSWSVAGSWSWS